MNLTPFSGVGFAVLLDVADSNTLFCPVCKSNPSCWSRFVWS